MDAVSTRISRPELITFDLRGMKAALLAEANAHGVSPSAFVRSTLAEAMGAAARSVATRDLAPPPTHAEQRARLSLRMSRPEAIATLAAARAAGMSPGVYVACLVAGIPALTSGHARDDSLAALVASNDRMASLGRSLRQLTRRNAMSTAECRATLERVAPEVRHHIATVSAVLRDLRPTRHPTCSRRS